MTIAPVRIGRATIGPGMPPVFWPDVDVYFKRDLALALHLVDTLAACGVGVIKTAALHDPECCLDTDTRAEYYVEGSGTVREPYRRIIERHAVPLDDLRRMFRYIRDRGLDLVVSVYDAPGVRLAVECGAVALKIPSSNIVHAPLVRDAAATGLPLVIDTGRATLDEIDRAVEWSRQAGVHTLIVQHSPPAPPAPPSDARLSVISMFAGRYGVPVGLSDHHSGLDLLPLAVALGANVIEKGVCADVAAPDIDLAHAMPVSKTPEALGLIDLAFKAVGQPSLEAREGLPAPPDRMGLVAATDLRPGDRISPATVRFAFPAIGLPVERWDEVNGRRVTRAVTAGTPVASEDVEQT